MSSRSNGVTYCVLRSWMMSCVSWPPRCSLSPTPAWRADPPGDSANRRPASRAAAGHRVDRRSGRWNDAGCGEDPVDGEGGHDRGRVHDRNDSDRDAAAVVLQVDEHDRDDDQVGVDEGDDAREADAAGPEHGRE